MGSELSGFQDQEVVFPIRLHKVVLRHQPVSRLLGLSYHDVPAHTVVFSVAVAIDDATPRLRPQCFTQLFSSATGSATSWYVFNSRTASILSGGNRGSSGLLR